VVSLRSTDRLEAISQMPVAALKRKMVAETPNKGSRQSTPVDLLAACFVVSSVVARNGDAPLLTPCKPPKSLTAPSTPIYELASSFNPLG
jgi:hypothetical protein